MVTCSFNAGLSEKRLLGYKFEGHWDRFYKTTTEDYDWSTPLGAAAGATHVVTAGFGLDPAIRQGLSHMDGSHTEGVQNYSGWIARTRENAFGLIGNVVRFRLPSAVGNLINVPGDAIADGADLLAGVSHRRGATGLVHAQSEAMRSQVESTLTAGTPKQQVELAKKVQSAYNTKAPTPDYVLEA
jgi:hypothetical protein